MAKHKHLTSQDSNRHSARRIAAAFALAALAAVATGCANRDATTTGSLPDDYRTRHPIVVGEQEKTIDMPIATGATRLTRGQQEVIAGFASAYSADSSGGFRIILPHGSRNAGAASAVSHEIRKVLTRYGVPAKKIIVQSYPADTPDEAAPVRLSYYAITASTPACGQWPEDLVVNTMENKNYYNFGCSVQNNLAAQIADPNDLLGPRRMTPADATARNAAMERYRTTYTELKDM